MPGGFTTVGFRIAMGKLFPDMSTKRASRFLDKSQRAVQRWLEVEAAPSNIMADMGHQVERLEVTGFEGDLDALIEQAKTNDIHPEVIAAHLAQRYTALLGREIE